MAPTDDDLTRALPDLARRVARRLLSAGPGTDGSAPRAGVHLTAGRERPGAAVEGPAGTDPGALGAVRAAGASPAAGGGRELLDVGALEGLAEGTELAVPAGALVTPLARDEAERRGIRLVDRRTRAVALGADHGGFALKAALADHLRRRGVPVHDLGTHDDRAVDYPDYAIAVAREVAAGRASVGVCVDGAGIGSAMAANKVPGVRAANCATPALATNAREHNHANVLTLGAGHLDAAAAAVVLDTFLATPFGPGRHARRVAKIDALDARPADPGAHARS